MTPVTKLHNFLVLNNPFTQVFHLSYIFLMLTEPHGFMFGSFHVFEHKKQVLDPELSTGVTTVNKTNRIINLTA